MYANRLRHHPSELRMRLLGRAVQIGYARENFRAVQPLRLERVTDFGLDTAVKPRLAREGSEEEAASEGERFHAKTTG